MSATFLICLAVISSQFIPSRATAETPPLKDGYESVYEEDFNGDAFPSGWSGDNSFLSIDGKGIGKLAIDCAIPINVEADSFWFEIRVKFTSRGSNNIYFYNKSSHDHFLEIKSGNSRRPSIGQAISWSDILAPVTASMPNDKDFHRLIFEKTGEEIRFYWDNDQTYLYLISDAKFRSTWDRLYFAASEEAPIHVDYIRLLKSTTARVLPEKSVSEKSLKTGVSEKEKPVQQKPGDEGARYDVWGVRYDLYDDAPDWPVRRQKWLKRYARMYQRIDEQAAKIDFDIHPTYRTQVRESACEIVVEKPTWSLYWDRQKAMITRGNIKGTLFEGIQLFNMVIETPDGKRYEQQYAGGGGKALATVNDQLVLYLRGTFVPRTAEGTPLSAVTVSLEYEIHKMGGMIFVNYAIDPAPLLVCNMVSFEGHLGRGSIPLSMVYVKSGEGAGSGTSWYVTDLNAPDRIPMGSSSRIQDPATGLVLRDKSPFSLWTNGREGFALYQVNKYWDAQVSDIIAADINEPAWMKVHTSGNERRLDMTPIHTDPRAPIKISKQYSYSLGLGILPPKRYEPLTGNYTSFEMPYYPCWTPRIEEYIRQLASLGARFTTPSGPGFSMPLGEDKMPANTRRYVNTLHKYGFKVLPYLEGGGACEPESIKLGILTPDEYEDLLVIWAPTDIGEVSGYSLQEYESRLRALGAKETDMRRGNGSQDKEIYRRWLLGQFDYQLSEYDVDGFYLDSVQVHSVGSYSRIRGLTTFAEQVRLLLDSYGDNKYFLVHSWMEVIVGIHALSDFLLPGEHRQGGVEVPFGRAELGIGYNPFISGAQPIPYNHESYHPAKPAVIRALTKNSLNAYLTHSPGIHEPHLYGAFYEEQVVIPTLNSKKDLQTVMTYFNPKVSFDIGRSTCHHPTDEDYRNYITNNNPQATAIAYSQPGETLLYVINASSPTSLILDSANLKLLSPELLVYDIVKGALTHVKNVDGRISLSSIPAGQYPAIFLIKERPNTPAMIWHDVIVWEYKERRQADNSYLVDIIGIPNSTGDIYYWTKDHDSPLEIVGGTLKRYDARHHIAVMAVPLDDAGKGRLSVAFAK